MQASRQMAALLAALALPLVAAPAAQASCRAQKNVGTVVGGVGGALVGHALFGGVAGTVLGGVGGAVAGHTVAGAGCHHYSRRAQPQSAGRYAPPQAQGYGPGSGPGSGPQVQAGYYDQYGRPITPASNQGPPH